MKHERLQCALEKARKQEKGATLHADMVRGVANQELDETSLQVGMGIAAIASALGHDEFWTGFMAAEVQRQAVAHIARVKKGGKR